MLEMQLIDNGTGCFATSHLAIGKSMYCRIDIVLLGLTILAVAHPRTDLQLFPVSSMRITGNDNVLCSSQLRATTHMPVLRVQLWIESTNTLKDGTSRRPLVLFGQMGMWLCPTC